MVTKESDKHSPIIRPLRSGRGILSTCIIGPYWPINRWWAAINDSVGKFPIPTRFECECHSHLSLGNPFPNRVINRPLRDSIQPRNRLPNNQRMNIIRALVGEDRLQIIHMAADWIFQGDTVGTKN